MAIFGLFDLTVLFDRANFSRGNAVGSHLPRLKNQSDELKRHVAITYQVAGVEKKRPRLSYPTHSCLLVFGPKTPTVPTPLGNSFVILAV